MGGFKTGEAQIEPLALVMLVFCVWISDLRLGPGRSSMRSWPGWLERNGVRGNMAKAQREAAPEVAYSDTVLSSQSERQVSKLFAVLLGKGGIEEMRLQLQKVGRCERGGFMK